MPEILLSPIDATAQVMRELEDRGLIVRLAPSNHELPAPPGQTKGTAVYRADAAFGQHMVLAVTCNEPHLRRFGHHLEREEFLFIGDPAREPLYLTFFRGQHPELAQKAADGSLCAGDFTCLRVAWNDPEASFFTMQAGVPHGECTLRATDRPPSFYVTESTGITTEKTDLRGFTLRIQGQAAP
ncbi:MAG: hypothetical protein AAGK14_04360 [Verrucomicrobiota bacterium]